MEILLAEEFERELGEAIVEKTITPEKISVAVTPEAPSTKIIDRRNRHVRAYEKIIESNKKGKMREFLVKSPSQNFRVYLEIDGVKRLDRSFQELQNISTYINFIDAFQDETTGEYILRIGETSWSKNANLFISVTEPLTFNQIFCVYEEF